MEARFNLKCSASLLSLFLCFSSSYAHAFQPQNCVAVIDTGIDLQHPLLSSALFKNGNENIENFAEKIDADDNGYPGDAIGWDFVDGDPDPFDERDDPLKSAIVKAMFPELDPDKMSDLDRYYAEWEIMENPIVSFHITRSDAAGHGTHVAGIVLQTRPSEKRCILPIRSGVNWRQVADAIDYAAGLGVRIINLSMGQFESSMTKADRADAKYMTEVMQRYPDLFFVMISHNQGRDLDADQGQMFPANVSIENKIVIGAIDDKGVLADFSNVSIDLVDLYAPGVEIMSAQVGGGQTKMSGTSMSAPFVAAIAAEILEQDAETKSLDIRKKILAQAERRVLEYVNKNDPAKSFQFEARVILPESQ